MASHEPQLHTPGIDRAAVLLVVGDPFTAASWYESALGYETTEIFTKPRRVRLVHDRYHDLLLASGTVRSAGHGVSRYYPVTEIDRLAERLEAMPRCRLYESGSELIVADPNGYRIVFAGPHGKPAVATPP